MYFRTIALAALVGAAPAADAAEVTLKFRLIIADTSATLMPVKNVEGRTLGAHEAVGVAVFEDGRLAFKRFVYTDDATEAEGDISGYSTYAFENGDSLDGEVRRPPGTRRGCREPTRSCRAPAPTRGRPGPAPSARPRALGGRQPLRRRLHAGGPGHLTAGQPAAGASAAGSSGTSTWVSTTR